MATNNAIDTNIPIDVAKGGTGSTTLTNHAVLVGATTSITSLAVGSTGTLLVGISSADPAFATSASGDFTFTSSTAGATRTLTVSNTNNSNASSNATAQITTGGASAGDPVTTYTVTGATSFTTGIDNSDSDKYKISASTALGTTDTFIMTTGGNNTKPLQCAFLAILGTSDTNKTGDGTDYTMGSSGNALTVTFDQSSSMNTNGTFTAPVTGKYFLTATFQSTSNTATSFYCQVRTSARDYRGMQGSGVAIADASNICTWITVAVANMTASDTATFFAQGAGTTKTVGFGGSSAPLTYCSGYLIC